ncbi:MAG: hypothetical protein H7Y15_08945 [Pseudonocardia sp.]|nr:hypothetical protein [Pseudonocardia sp.]
MTGLLIGDQFGELLRSATTARRLETRLAYTLSPAEQDQEPSFLAGGLDASPAFADWWVPWKAQVQRAIDEGGGYERVRVAADPPTDYQRYALWSSTFNVDAGETVLYLGRGAAAEVGVPDGDFWVLDHRTVLLMHFALDDVFLGATAVTDPEVVSYHDAWIDTAAAAAVPRDQYVLDEPSRAQPG